MPEA
jgi:hypothetical protein